MAIQTVLGPIEKLDFCHSHEHLFIAPGHPGTLNPALTIDNYDLTKQEVEHFLAAGGKAIVDAQPLGCGRMEKEQVRLAQETGLQLILPTGFHKLSFYPDHHWIKQESAQQLAAIFIHELKNGMYIGTDQHYPDTYIEAKAGFIKVAIDQARMDDPDKRWFEAAAIAAKATGCSIMCHIESSRQAWYLYQFFKEHGVESNRIIICHLDRSLDEPDQHIRMAQEGVFLEYDTIGRFKYHNDENELVHITMMIRAGFGDHILLGLDTTRERLKSYQGSIGLTYLIESFLPGLRSKGVTEQELDALMTTNPTRAFSIQTP
ncbi:phosphotriesterase family protein [Paenibacillus paeoniae]|uniref:Phosphotriesterase n=1 Tax=Paenibacillus paeoniae TaxID=2292705 RepID=A0A371P6R9_9BACL|nr:hypothetical protein [Paenibacillus paeoniae]REK71200.1 hypothetical protein DX130_22405 [Paenibacillus paeoniae]